MNRLANRFLSMDTMKMYHFFIALFMMGSMLSSPLLKLPIVIVAFVNLIIKNDQLEKWSVLFYSFNFLGTWFLSYYIVANHHSLLAIFTLYITYRIWFKDKSWNFPFYLLSLVILVATIQKLLSPYFMNGNLVGELFLSGTSFPQLGTLVDADFNENVTSFLDRFYNMKYNHTSVGLNITDKSVLLSKAITWIIVISEVLLSIALIILRPVKKYYAILLFLIGTAVFRSEFGFFCTLLLISCFDTNIQNQRVQQWLKALFLVFTIIYCYITQGYF